MDWIIRVIEGPDEGLVQPLHSGPNVIGRGKAAAIKLSVEDVSWEHAVVVREQDECILENLSALGTWVGDARVTGRVRLRPGDKIRLTEQTVLRVESADGPGMSRALLISALVAMVLILGVVFYYQVLAPPKPVENWESAYNTLLPWLKSQADHHQVPPEAVVLFYEAWRHSEAADWPASEKTWIRLEIVLASPQCKPRCLELAARDQGAALNLILAPPPGFEPTDEQCASAVGKFADRWLQYSVKVQENNLNPLKNR
jgi:hypothetical protein